MHFTQAAALERAQALTSINVCTPRGEGPDRRADRRLPVQRRLRQDAVAAGPARHRRAPRRHAAEVPPPGRAARPGRPAQGHLRHRHPRRRHQRADPDGGVHRPVASTTGAASGCSRPASSTRSPAAPGGPASTPPAPSSCRRPSTSSRTPGWSRRPATTPRSSSGCSARSRPRGSSPGPRRPSTGWSPPSRSRCVSRMRVTHAMLLNVIARPGRPVRRRCAGCCATTTRTPRSQLRLVRRAVAQHRSLLAAGVVERVDPPEPDGRRVRLVDDLQLDFALNQPLSTFALAAFDMLDPEAADVRPRRRVGRRGDPGGPAAGAGRPGVPGARRGGRRR